MQIDGLSVLVGVGTCNAKCSFCALKDIRSTCEIGIPDKFWPNLEFAVKLAARNGAHVFSISSAGEPTCEPGAILAALDVYSKCAKYGAFMPSVLLFTNGVKLGDAGFCEKWLPMWRAAGLTQIAVSVHDCDPVRQAEAYGISRYPNMVKIFQAIKGYGFSPRATILLRRGWIDGAEKFASTLEHLRTLGYESVACRTCEYLGGGTVDGTPDTVSVSDILRWLLDNAATCPSLDFGDLAFEWRGMLVRFKDFGSSNNPNRIRRLVVMHDGSVRTSWKTSGNLLLP